MEPEPAGSPPTGSHAERDFQVSIHTDAEIHRLHKKIDYLMTDQGQKILEIPNFSSNLSKNSSKKQADAVSLQKNLRGLDIFCRFKTELLNRLVPHHKLLDLPGDTHGEVVDEENVPRDLEMGDLSFAEVFYILIGHGLAWFHLHPGAQFLAVFYIRYPTT